jgi:nitrite reductase/ring-hydroxylating ferredoxin subunit
MASWTKAASLTDLEPGDVLGVALGSQRVALYNKDGRIFATDDICSHAYAHLSDGIFDVDDCTIECPIHAARFHVLTGQPLDRPATRGIRVFETRIEDGEIYVLL